MEEMLTRSKPLVGAQGLKRLKDSSVAVFGLGGVGGAAAEGLCRAGVGKITLVDGDIFSITNLNRQIFCLRSTLGKNKAAAAAARLADINPDCRLTAYEGFFNRDTAADFDFKGFDYVLDAVDSVKDKVLLAVSAKEAGTPIISAMGAGGKLYADFIIGDIYETKGCPLARAMRRELKKAGIERLAAVYSEECGKAAEETEHAPGKRPPSSISYVPPVCGYIAAGHIIRELAGIARRE